tara:strand:- start:2819 stop:3460 length:642 start_codon:yes stop_codon:yes gene_type:complete
MEDSRKQSILEKLAAGESKKPNLGFKKSLMKEMTSPEALGKALRGALLGAAALGAKKAGPAVWKKLGPKKSFKERMIGEGTPGRKALMFGAGAAGIAGGIKAIDAGSEAISSPLKKKKYFNDMMDDNPALKRESSKDVKRIFSTLYRFNPKMASDPLVAGSFLKRSLQFKEEGIQPVDVKTLTEVAKNIEGAKKKDTLLSRAFLGGAGELAAI